MSHNTVMIWKKIANIVVVVASLTLVISARAETQKAVFGAGCFWCMEAIYEQQPGVVKVVAGYAGGKEPNPTYHEVGSGKTGHAEAIEVEFDPSKTSYEKLVDYFWTTHDPTDKRGVWPDFGPQYRSMLLYANEDQKKAIEASKARQKNASKIVTEIAPVGKFYPAEDYHQNYAKKNPNDPYVQRITIPKLKKLGLAVP